MKHVAMTAVSGLAVSAIGCVPGLGLPAGTPMGVAGEVAAKAEAIAAQVGGESGFGGTEMNGYRQHMGANMGFDGMADLADGSSQMTMRFHNQSDQECTFRLVYAASHMELTDETMEVTVGTGATETIEVPCAEMVGLGSMTSVGEVACELEDGTMFDNRMCVPGFLNSDYDCASGYDCLFGKDADDVDADGDTEEMMATTEALRDHLGPMGMMGAHRGS